jgi:regulator of nucleoside diphosphate kinase
MGAPCCADEGINIMKNNDLILKESDYDKLTKLIGAAACPITKRLEQKLARADVVHDDLQPTDAVCLGSQVTFVVLDTGKRQTVQVVDPDQANAKEMKISVLTPIGSALIGLRVGGVIDWNLPNGRASIKVLSIT